LSKIRLILGDCLEKLKELPDNSVDSIVTDPPYGWSFMGKKWDYDLPKVEVFKEMLRVLKYGGHILCACGTRTQHRMAVNIEDAGFEIRDVVAWVYGSGFPKSLNIGKAVDKLQGNEREEYNPGGRYNYSFQEGNSQFVSETATKSGKRMSILPTKGSSPYEGWGTALKPAMELWTLARKPLSENTVAENVLRWGTGGINIDGCRVACNDKAKFPDGIYDQNSDIAWRNDKRTADTNAQGRFPANLIHDGSDEVVGLFPDGIKPSFRNGDRVSNKDGIVPWNKGRDSGRTVTGAGYTDSGSAARFFYCAKASKAERNRGLEGFEEKTTGHGNLHNSDGFERFDTKNQNHHPTVKPVALMRYLCRLITPKNGIVLDPFMGSGSTGIAAKEEGFDFIGIEMEAEYLKIAEARIGK